MKVVVLGAGVVGTTSAWFLAKAGHEVTVVDRQPGAGLETSYANGGQISVSHAEPWANPSAPLKVAKWLATEDAPLLFRLRLDVSQWLWSLAFLRECLPARTRQNIRHIVNLGLYSRAALQDVRRETGIEYDQRTAGILHFYTDAREFEAAIEPTRLMQELGCDRSIKTAEECLAIEPALQHAEVRVVGGTYTPSDESGDAHIFTTRLAELAAAKGVRFRYGTSALAMTPEGDRIRGVTIATAAGEISRIEADAYVVSLGSYSAPMMRRLGIRLPIYPAKGYSATIPVVDESRAPVVSLTDDEYKLVFSRLGNRLRVAGTAELNGYSTDLNETRCRALLRRTERLFGSACDLTAARFWTGLRPATPGNVPLIGGTRYRNLYLNTGHGTLGWTHACGSAKALASIVSGEAPEIDFAFARAA